MCLEIVYNGKKVKSYFFRKGLQKELKILCEKLIRVFNIYLRYLRKKYEEKLVNEFDEDEESWNLLIDLVYNFV